MFGIHLSSYYLHPDGPIAVEALRVIGAAMAEARVVGLGRLTRRSISSGIGFSAPITVSSLRISGNMCWVTATFAN